MEGTVVRGHGADSESRVLPRAVGRIGPRYSLACAKRGSEAVAAGASMIDSGNVSLRHALHLDGVVAKEHDPAPVRRGVEGLVQHGRDESRAGMSLGLALWILVAPAADWSWTILDGPFDLAVRCDARREARLPGDATPGARPSCV